MNRREELKKFRTAANKEFDHLTQWMNGNGYKTAPVAIKEFATTHCENLLDEIEKYTAELNNAEV